MGIKRGIIQSRGLGDIVIALPIARYYHDQGDTVVWPICREFLPAVERHVPWVQWIGMETDQQGRFFLQTPLQLLQAEGCDPQEALYLYQYLSSAPELTDPELYNILKFDQYKYQSAGVPFRDKWRLAECVTRDPEGEAALKAQLNLTGPYVVAHLKGSSAEVDRSVVQSLIDPAARLVVVDDYTYNSVFDWIPVLEGAATIVCLDSVFANMVDQWGIEGPELLWFRRSPWDLTPVMGSHWKIVPTNLPIREPQRVNPQAEAEKKAAIVRAQQAGAPHPGVQSHVPFQTDKSKIPQNFMHALKK